MSHGSPKRCRARGSAMVEFAFVFSFLMVPLLMGTLTLGLNLVRVVQLTEVARSLARMYYNGTDLSTTANKNLALAIAPELGITASGGNGVIYLTQVHYVSSTDCTNAGYSSGCSNSGKTVFVNRITLGSTSVHSSSALGAPSCTLGSNGNVSSACEYTTTSDQVNATSIVSLASGQTAYIAEIWITTPDLAFWKYLGTTGASARAVFGS